MRWQPCAGIEIRLEPAEIAFAQRTIDAQLGDQFLEALRHVEVECRRNLLEIAHGLVDPARQRLAVIDIERATIVQRQPEIVVAAECVVPGQPIHQNRRLILHEGQPMPQHRLVGGQHPMRVDHALGMARRAGGEQHLGDGLRPHGLMRLGNQRIGFIPLEQSRERRGVEALDRAFGAEDLTIRWYDSP